MNTENKTTFISKANILKKKKISGVMFTNAGNLELANLQQELERFSKDLLMNAFIPRNPLKNQGIVNLLMKTFEFYITELHKEREKK